MPGAEAVPDAAGPASAPVALEPKLDALEAVAAILDSMADGKAAAASSSPPDEAGGGTDRAAAASLSADADADADADGDVYAEDDDGNLADEEDGDAWGAVGPVPGTSVRLLGGNDEPLTAFVVRQLLRATGSHRPHFQFQAC